MAMMQVSLRYSVTLFRYTVLYRKHTRYVRTGRMHFAWYLISGITLLYATLLRHSR